MGTLKQVLLHVGPAKTGTTSIQHALSAITEDLRMDGICYPKTTPLSQEGQPSLAWEILEKVAAPIARLSKAHVTWEQAFSEVEAISAHTLLVSSEDFSSELFDEAAALVLREVLGDIPVSIIFGVRSPLSVVPSIWQQSVKWGCGFGEELLDIDDAIPLIAGRPQVEVIPYIERLRLPLKCEVRFFIIPTRANVDALFGRFADAAGLPPRAAERMCSSHSASNSNSGMSFRDLLVILNLNRILAQSAPEDACYPRNGSESRLVARDAVLQSLPVRSKVTIPLNDKSLDALRRLRARIAASLRGEPNVVGPIDELFEESYAENCSLWEADQEIMAVATHTLSGALALQTDRYLKLSEYCVELENARDWWRSTSDSWERAARASEDASARDGRD